MTNIPTYFDAQRMTYRESNQTKPNQTKPNQTKYRMKQNYPH